MTKHMARITSAILISSPVVLPVANQQLRCQFYRRVGKFDKLQTRHSLQLFTVPIRLRELAVSRSSVERQGALENAGIKDDETGLAKVPSCSDGRSPSYGMLK